MPLSAMPAISGRCVCRYGTRFAGSQRFLNLRLNGICNEKVTAMKADLSDLNFEQPVRIVSGPFRGLEGRIHPCRFRDDGRYLLDIDGFPVGVHIVVPRHITQSYGALSKATPSLP
jgi:hypothetical protein